MKWWSVVALSVFYFVIQLFLRYKFLKTSGVQKNQRTTLLLKFVMYRQFLFKKKRFTIYSFSVLEWKIEFSRPGMAACRRVKGRENVMRF